MALHEIGHVLGFVSGIDGILNLETLYSGETEIDNFTVLDLFRFSSNSASVENSDGEVSDVSIGGDAYFSVDGGETNLGDFSTGQQTALGGDGFQASHWKRLKNAMGIMDPTLAFKERLSLSLLDLQAMDAVGWDIDYSRLQSDSLDLASLLLEAELSVAHSLGIDSELFTSSRGNKHLYKIGYSQWWQIFETQILEMGYSQWWQIFEAGHEAWQDQDSLLNMGYSQWWQAFEDRVYEMGYSQWWQQFEGDMLNMGYSQWWQLFEMGYSRWWQKLEVFFAKLDTVEGSSAVDPTEVTTGVVGGSIEQVYRGGAEDDILSGTAQQDRITGGVGDDFIDGREGHDVLEGNEGKDILYGFDGNDLLKGGSGDDLLLGEKGDDELYGDTGHDVLSGAEGEDLLSGGTGKDELKGGWDNDVLSGDDGDDSLSGESGQDVLVGGQGNDNLEGGSGHDLLYGDRSSIYLTENLRALKKQILAGSDDQSAATVSVSEQSSVLNPVRIEAESMALSGQYQIRNRDNDSGSSVRSSSNVVGTSTFQGQSGQYMVLARYHDDADGNGTLAIGVNGSLIDQWTLDRNDEVYHTRTVAQSITLNTGDQISFTATPSAPNSYGEIDNAYIDYIELVPLSNLLSVALESPVVATSANPSQSGNTGAIASVPSLRVEAESMTLAGEYYAASASYASGGSLIEVSNKGTGLALTSFTGQTGYYDIVLAYHDENDDGIAQISAALNGEELDSWSLDQNLGGMYADSSNLVERTIAKGVLLNSDDVLQLQAIRGEGYNSDEPARIDYVEFVAVAAPDTQERLSFSASEDLAPVLESGLLAYWNFDEASGSEVSEAVSGVRSTAWKKQIGLREYLVAALASTTAMRNSKSMKLANLIWVLTIQTLVSLFGTRQSLAWTVHGAT